jgi:hypothetical protein
LIVPWSGGLPNLHLRDQPTMPAPHPLLVDIVAKVTGERYSTVNNTARRLRESKLWPSGGFGNASFQREVSVVEAAYLLIALYSGGGPTGSNHAVNDFMKLRWVDDINITALDIFMTYISDVKHPYSGLEFVFYIEHTPPMFELRQDTSTPELSAFLSEHKTNVTRIYTSILFVDPTRKEIHKGAVNTIAVPHQLIHEIATQAQLLNEKASPPFL